MSVNKLFRILAWLHNISPATPPHHLSNHFSNPNHASLNDMHTPHSYADLSLHDQQQIQHLLSTLVATWDIRLHPSLVTIEHHNIFDLGTVLGGISIKYLLRHLEPFFPAKDPKDWGVELLEGFVVFALETGKVKAGAVCVLTKEVARRVEHDKIAPPAYEGNGRMGVEDLRCAQGIVLWGYGWHKGYINGTLDSWRVYRSDRMIPGSSLEHLNGVRRDSVVASLPNPSAQAFPITDGRGGGGETAPYDPTPDMPPLERSSKAWPEQIVADSDRGIDHYRFGAIQRRFERRYSEWRQTGGLTQWLPPEDEGGLALESTRVGNMRGAWGVGVDDESGDGRGERGERG
ncbi:hypothetical protein P154DRAFT_606657 [Amniculicola lignicola CBS 123094]|uniref:Uncharacterized protein n=1 Tax=Amniculicola lignicola CBS 123094 TaxID=1392246 RepID=A0A6A5W624_9PLEO|nr:hypothetical protein P154DRAFT_606657 [Amniculicola lignicola CBS 123094]